MGKVGAHIYISGLVQGVFFRAHTREEAVKRGLTGWVRNLPDGRVEALFEGDKNQVDDMIKWCHKGPPSSQVSDVEIHWEETKGNFNGFRIMY